MAIQSVTRIIFLLLLFSHPTWAEELTVYGDGEILEETEGYLWPQGQSVPSDAIPDVEYLSGTHVQSTFTFTDSGYLVITLIPDEVSKDTRSSVRITWGNKSTVYAFKVINKATPEQAHGRTIAQCTSFYNKGDQVNVAGHDAFSFDKRIVDTIKTGGEGMVSRIISTNRKIINRSSSGYVAFQSNGDIRVGPKGYGSGTDWVLNKYFRKPKKQTITNQHFYHSFKLAHWYAGSGRKMGMTYPSRRGGGTSLWDNEWTSMSINYSYPNDYSSESYNVGAYTNNKFIEGRWHVTLERSVPLQSGDTTAINYGTSKCVLIDEEDMTLCGGSFRLASNKWRQISLPCYPAGSKNTVSDIFANIPGKYGMDWGMYRYTEVYQKEKGIEVNKYVQLKKDEVLKQYEGYWIIQLSGHPITLTMPKGSIPTLTTYPASCTSENGCYAVPLVIARNQTQMNMVGYPFDKKGRLGDVRVTTLSNHCNSQAGCNLDTANTRQVVHNQFWTYTDNGYKKIRKNDTLEAWRGYWVAALSDVTTESLINRKEGPQLSLHIPKP
jgi:hypothetical protein